MSAAATNLDQAAAAVLTRLAAEPGHDPTPAGRRQAMTRRTVMLAGSREPGVDSEDLSFTARDGYRVPVRVYRAQGDDSAPLVVFAHGGGWVTGDLDTHDVLCAALTRRAGCLLMAVDYRLAPEHPWPVPDRDVADALGWALAGGISGTAGRPLVLAGDSAGGAIAGGLAATSPLPVDGLLLWYPIAAKPRPTASYIRFACGYGLDQADMRWYWQCYSPDGDAMLPADLPAASMPQTLLVAAECDVLRDEGLAYAARLQSAGTTCTRVEFPGMIHGFARMTAAIPAAWQAIDRAAAFVRSFSQ